MAEVGGEPQAPVQAKRKRSPNVSPRKQRPPYWSAEWFLKWRRENATTPITAQYQIWSMEWGTSPASIAAEIRIWKNTIAGFRAKLGEIDGRATDPDKANGHTLDDFTPGWRERFCSYYRTGAGVTAHHRKRSADAAGLSWETIRKKLYPKGSDYDPAFAALVEEIEAETTEDSRAGIKTALEIARDTEDARTLGKLSLDVLERREPNTWARNQKVTVEGTIFHAPAAVRQAALGEAVEVSRRGALPAHVEGVEIVEAEYVLERAG